MISVRLIFAAVFLIGLARIAVAADAINGTHVLTFPESGSCRDGGKTWAAREMTGRQMLEAECPGGMCTVWRITATPANWPAQPRWRICATEDRPK